MSSAASCAGLDLLQPAFRRYKVCPFLLSSSSHCCNKCLASWKAEWVNCYGCWFWYQFHVQSWLCEKYGNHRVFVGIIIHGNWNCQVDQDQQRVRKVYNKSCAATFTQVVTMRHSFNAFFSSGFHTYIHWTIRKKAEKKLKCFIN